jgi:hypothetical protein
MKTTEDIGKAEATLITQIYREKRNFYLLCFSQIRLLKIYLHTRLTWKKYLLKLMEILKLELLMQGYCELNM